MPHTSQQSLKTHDENRGLQRERQVYIYSWKFQHPIIDQTTKQKISSDTEDLNSVSNQLDLTVFIRLCTTNSGMHIFLSMFKTFTKRHRILGHQATYLRI